MLVLGLEVEIGAVLGFWLVVGLEEVQALNKSMPKNKKLGRLLILRLVSALIARYLM